MNRAGPVLLLTASLLAGCAGEARRQENYHASWLAERPRIVRVEVSVPPGGLFYSVEEHDVAKGTVGGAAAGFVVAGTLVGGWKGDCGGGCAKAVAGLIGGSALIGGIIGFLTTPGDTITSYPAGDSRVTAPLAPPLERAGREIVDRTADSFAEDLRRWGGHRVAVVAATDKLAGEPPESEITITLSRVELVGPRPRENSRVSLRVTLDVQARWRGSVHTQRFHYRSEAADLKDWRDPDGEAAARAVSLAVSSLSARIVDALAEP